MRPSEASRGPCYVLARLLAPFRPKRAWCGSIALARAVPCRSPLSKEALPLRATPRRLGLPLGSPRPLRRRCFSPTSATDTHNEHPWIARLPGTWLAPRRPQDACREITRSVPFPCGAVPPFGNPTPADQRLTTLDQLRPARLTVVASPNSSRRWRVGDPSGPHHTRALSSRVQLSEWPLTPPVAPRPSPENRRAPRCPGPLPSPPRQRGRLSRPETPSIDGCLLSALSRSPMVGDPPPIPPLCRGRVGFRRSFTCFALAGAG